MHETAQQARARKEQREASWQGLEPAQRRGVAMGYSMMFVALAIGASQPKFNGVAVLAMFMALAGLLTCYRALTLGRR